MASVMIFTLIGCNTETQSSTIEETDWPDQISLIQHAKPEDDFDQKTLDLFRKHLTKELGINVIDHEAEHYYLAIDALAKGTLDIMLANPQSYYLINQLAEAELLAALKTEGDDYAAFITRRENETIQHLQDLRGKKIAFVNESSASGYLYPKGTLVKTLKLDPELIEESGYFFKRVLFSESETNSVIGLISGDVDVIAIGIKELEKLIEVGLILPQDIKIIATTPDIPKAAFIVRKDLPEDFKDALREAFISFENEHYFATVHQDPYARFDYTTPNYYDPAIDLLGVIHALESAINDKLLSE